MYISVKQGFLLFAVISLVVAKNVVLFCHCLFSFYLCYY